MGEGGLGPSMAFVWYQGMLRQGSRARRAVEPLRVEFGVEPLVSANRNKSISFLSDAAEPQCVLVKELQLGRRYANNRETDVTAVNASDSPRGDSAVAHRSRPLRPRSETGQVADSGRLSRPVYTL